MHEWFDIPRNSIKVSVNSEASDWITTMLKSGRNVGNKSLALRNYSGMAFYAGVMYSMYGGAETIRWKFSRSGVEVMTVGGGGATLDLYAEWLNDELALDFTWFLQGRWKLKLKAFFIARDYGTTRMHGSLTDGPDELGQLPGPKWMILVWIYFARAKVVKGCGSCSWSTMMGVPILKGNRFHQLKLRSLTKFSSDMLCSGWLSSNWRNWGSLPFFFFFFFLWWTSYVVKYVKWVEGYGLRSSPSSPSPKCKTEHRNHLHQSWLWQRTSLSTKAGQQ